MPSKAVDDRAGQVKLVRTLLHSEMTSAEYRRVLEDLAERVGELSETDQVNVRQALRQLQKGLQLPAEFVARKAKAFAAGYSAWVKAREEDDFAQVRSFLEEQLIHGELSVAELPEAWNALYEEYLGVKVPSDKLGVLQDVHWYGVGFGYFPTYALGNLYCGIMLEQIQRVNPDLDKQIRQGDFSVVLSWLRDNVHAHGARYCGPELAKRISGRSLSVKPFLGYLGKKFSVSFP